MEPVDITKEKITIKFSRQELVFINDAILETLEAIEEWEFQTRTGETRAFAKEMLGQLHKFLDEAQQA